MFHGSTVGTSQRLVVVFVVPLDHRVVRKSIVAAGQGIVCVAIEWIEGIVRVGNCAW